MSDEHSYLLELSPEDYQKATVEVGFLLDAFAATIDNIMGGNTAPVGRIAGRDTAKKLPVHLDDPSLEEIVAVLAERMQAGFEFALLGDELTFQGCILRQICAVRKIETGGALCRLFHAYFDGIVNGLLCRPVKSSIGSIGETCTLKLDVQ
jgi:hypothetical protein